MARKKIKNDLRTMNAKASLYGSQVTPISALRVIMAYEIGIIAFATLLYTVKQFILIGIVVVLGAIFVYRSILPYRVDDVYRQRGETERSQFMHLVTQGMSTQDANITSVMLNAATSAKGEFYYDIMQVIVHMQASRHYHECHPAFKAITDKYSEDIFFAMFMEQCETTFYESHYDIRTFRTFQAAHDAMIAGERKFLKSKSEYQFGLVMLMGVLLLLTALIMFAQGYKTYLQLWVSPVGLITSTVEMILFGMLLRKFYKRYYDNDVTSE